MLVSRKTWNAKIVQRKQYEDLEKKKSSLASLPLKTINTDPVNSLTLTEANNNADSHKVILVCIGRAWSIFFATLCKSF